MIEVADAAAAESLKHAVGTNDVDVVPVDGHVELRVGLLGHNPESRVVAVLNAIDGWLVDSHVDAVRVKLDGTSYTLHPPRA